MHLMFMNVVLILSCLRSLALSCPCEGKPYRIRKLATEDYWGPTGTGAWTGSPNGDGPGFDIMSRMDLGPNSTSKASSRGEDYPIPYKQTTSPQEVRITQFHISKTLVHSPTNVGLLPTLTPPSRPDPTGTGAWTGRAQNGMDLALIPCQE
ncbi:hypothetical protein FXO38_01390 [Capsicum annuum]|nr:hypothetical protein FXO38_01390 [Capsicum annuum]